jgi:outer membrane protein OmpA-like peptidoglycan-associated protein
MEPPAVRWPVPCWVRPLVAIRKGRSLVRRPVQRWALQPGAGVGQMMDKQEAEMRDALAASEAAAVRREGDLLAITLKGDFSFDLDSDVVRPGLYTELDRISQIMINYPQTSILVEGHTDGTGSEAYNQRLSERRATSVKNLLISRGVQEYRINTIGYGKSRPVATNATPEGRQMNRRVEIRINPNTQG